MNKRKILVISSISPQPTSAGQIILYRHLNQASGWDVDIVANPYESKTDRWQTKLIKRLEYTRFHPWGHDFQVIDQGMVWDNTLLNSHQRGFNSQTDDKTIVLTVSHGDGCWAAQRFAHHYQLPLVTIFHDWWPDIPTLHKPFRQLLEQRFQQLYQQSNLALCVSEGMKNALGSHSNSTVLYPIPAFLKEEITTKYQPENEQISSPLQVVYSGNLHEYGPILAQLLEVTKDNPKIQVQVRGSNPNWSADFRSEMRDRNLWLDFAPREELNQWLAAADVFLVTMSFDQALRRRMETSFPSKLPEYAQFGKPLVIWGPDYCSAIRWGSEGDRALCITDENPQVLVSAVEKLSQDSSQREYYASQSRIAARQDFNPVNLQKHFLAAISTLLA
ncbi:MAG TPA: glycosyltransferase [Nodularia sp. (in: cyanobacteria)]|nr:glycosyltransferase [Nodularia sp. (in: cyanobacteria)]